MPLEDVKPDEGKANSPEPPHKRKSASHQIAMPPEDVKPDEGGADSPEPPHKKLKSASHQIANTDDESADGDVKENEPDEVQCQESEVCSPNVSDNEQASEDSSSSSSSESTKVRRGNLDKVMSCLEYLQEVNPDCEDCAKIISEAKAHLKACL